MKYNDMHICKLMFLGAAKWPLQGVEGPTFLFIKIDSRNLVRIYRDIWYAYMWVNVPQRHVLALAWGPSRGPEGGASHIYKSLYLVLYEQYAYQILIFYLIIRVWRGWMPILNLTVQEINFCHHKFPNYCFIFFYIDITISNAWYIEYWYRVEIFNIDQLYIWVCELCENSLVSNAS